MIDFTKPVRTKLDKYPVTIISTIHRNPLAPVMGYIDFPGREDHLMNQTLRFWKVDGGAEGGMCYDLENVPPPPPPPVKRWLVWTECANGKIYSDTFDSFDGAYHRQNNRLSNPTVCKVHVQEVTMEREQHASN